MIVFTRKPPVAGLKSLMLSCNPYTLLLIVLI